MTNSSSANQAARALLALAKSFEAKADVDRRVLSAIISRLRGPNGATLGRRL